jgi:PhnB protein
MKKLIPHLYFDGNCLEAINFYLHIFKGEIEALDKYKDQPLSVKKELENKILFAHFKFDGGEFYASDLMENDQKDSQPIVLWLEMESKEELGDYLEKLKKPEQNIEIKQTFFGNHHAEIQDQFNVKWNLFCH